MIDPLFVRAISKFRFQINIAILFAASRTTISSVSEDATKVSAVAASEESSSSGGGGKTAVSSALSLDTAMTTASIAATSSVYLNKSGPTRHVTVIPINRDGVGGGGRSPDEEQPPKSPRKLGKQTKFQEAENQGGDWL